MVIFSVLRDFFIFMKLYNVYVNMVEMAFILRHFWKRDFERIYLPFFCIHTVGDRFFVIFEKDIRIFKKNTDRMRA